ncbi:uncharacterized protein METZ01_LOCUS406572, partial [marine metagenome]
VTATLQRRSPLICNVLQIPSTEITRATIQTTVDQPAIKQ